MKTKIPDLGFDYFTFKQIKTLKDSGKIFINSEYQRSSVWKEYAQVELIKSIMSSYSIGVLVVYQNEDGNYEILDGQQRLNAIYRYIAGKLKVSNTDLEEYDKLEDKIKDPLNGYCIYYLEIKNQNRNTAEEDMTQIFLRLQEGTPLNRAEKINAHRGKFKNLFRDVVEKHNVFKLVPNDYRFRKRLLCAELLAIELESNFDEMSFPSLYLKSLETILRKYSKFIHKKQENEFVANLDMMAKGLNCMLTGMKERDVISFYILVSYLRKKRVNQNTLSADLEKFSEKFMKNVSIAKINEEYDSEVHIGITQRNYYRFKHYKVKSRQATTSDSVKFRAKFILEEFNKHKKIMIKDQKRFADIQLKQDLFFIQESKCWYCKKKFSFKEGVAHHLIEHGKGGRTGNAKDLKLVHEKCHNIIHNKKKK